MHRYILLSAILMMATIAHSQTKFDLQKPMISGDVRETYLKDKKRHGDPVEPMTTLPVYTTFDVEGFTYGPVAFTHGGEFGPDEPLDGSSIGFMLKSVAERVPIGFIISIEKTNEAKTLADYVIKTYGKGKMLSTPFKPNSAGEKLGRDSYLYRDIQSNLSMILTIQYSLKDKKSAVGTTLYIIKTDTKPNPNVHDFPTALARMSESFRQ